MLFRSAALYQRQHTGRGQRIQVAMTDHISTFIRIHYGYPIEQNVPTPRPGNWVPFTRKIAPAEAYPCKPFGPNDWLVDEMYRKFRDDPSSVSESWQEFFADYRPRAEVPAPSRPPTAAVVPSKAGGTGTRHVAHGS